MLIQNTSQNNADSLAVKMLIFGQSGVGKTTLAKTIGEPTILVSAEAGLLSIAGSDVDFVDISKDDSGAAIDQDKRYDRFKEVMRYLMTEEAKKRWKWLFIDSLSEINQNMLFALEKKYPEAKDNLPKYGELSKQMLALIKGLRDIPHYNVVMTALSETDKDDTGRRFIGVSVIGKIAERIPAYLDEVFYMGINKDDKGNETRMLLTGPTDAILCKDRSNSLDKLEAPNLAAIAAKIRAKTTTTKQTEKKESKK